MDAMEMDTDNSEAVRNLELNESSRSSTSTMTAAQTISADEVALYDRQIRLWGMEAQLRMRNSKILLITMRGLANEVAKNLVLAGIGSLTVMDPEVVEEDDLGASFFFSEEHVGQNRAEAALPAIQALNPRVPCHASIESPLTASASFYSSFSLIIATDLLLPTLLHLNQITRSHSIPFYAAATYGLYGFIFADLLVHSYVLKRIKSNVATRLGPESRTRSIISTRETQEGETRLEHVTKQETFCPLSEALSSMVDSSWPLRRKKKLPSVLPGIMAMLQFTAIHNRLPDPDVTREDLKEFVRIITPETERMGLPVELNEVGFMRSFLQNATAELSPVAAILGGVLAQDAINVLAKTEQPVGNFCVFDGEIGVAPIVVLAAQEEE
ncbi:hypothetical protein FPQ18DRAFT_298574 [Pyronema domesticum]|nr:hypothetical protein FPQ18DRAFT_298574 [Pyronema domesticum]